MSTGRPDVYFTAQYGNAGCTDPNSHWLSIDRHDGLFQIPLITRPVAGGRLDAASPYGYSGAFAHPELSAPDVELAWASAVRELRDRNIVSVFLRHSPLVPQARLPLPHVPVVRDHPTVAVDTRDVAVAWLNLESRCRNTVRKALKLGASVDLRPATAVDLKAGSDFRTLYEQTMARRGATGSYYFPDQYYERLLDGLRENLLLARGLDADGTVQSAALFLHHDGLLHYHLSGSARDAGRTGLNNLVLWTAVEHAAAVGVHTLHLGGGVGSDDNLLRFKGSFGPNRLSYAATGLVVDPVAYAALSGEREFPSGPPSFFPAYRAGGSN